MFSSKISQGLCLILTVVVLAACSPQTTTVEITRLVEGGGGEPVVETVVVAEGEPIVGVGPIEDGDTSVSDDGAGSVGGIPDPAAPVSGEADEGGGGSTGGTTSEGGGAASPISEGDSGVIVLDSGGEPDRSSEPPPLGGDIIILPFPEPPIQPPVGQSGLLTAGDVDDHLNFGWYLNYIDGRLQQYDNLGLPFVALSDRVAFRIVDGSGQPVSNARIAIKRGFGTVYEGWAGTNGMFYFFPQNDTSQRLTQFTVEVRPPVGGQALATPVNLTQLNYNYRDILQITLPNVTASLPQALDLVFVLDTTGSMGDELSYLTVEFESIVANVQQLYPQVSMRFGLVVYRDLYDVYVTQRYGFTDSPAQMIQWLRQQNASGGGDYPEAMEQGVREALNGFNWRSGNTARVLFLVADAPPHARNYTDMVRQIQAARAAGIRIYPVAASGTADEAEYMLRLSAVLTQGRYVFLTDDSGVGNPHAEPKTPCYVVTPLDRLITRILVSELAGTRAEPNQSEIYRMVGNYQNGVCVPQGQ